ncbi:MAG: VanZ family protein [Actinobacteria bacterium]|nr:VanZ family protein [Actinomycetota bacterium]
MAKGRWLAVAGWMLVILYLSTKRVTVDYASTLPGLVHFIEYGILAVLVRVALAPVSGVGSLVLDVLTFLWASGYGALVEVAQFYIPTRTADVNDALINAMGALVAVVGMRLAMKIKQKPG